MPETPAYAGPTVRKLAREFGLDLSRVEGTGEGGRVQTEDLTRHVQQALAGNHVTTAALTGEADITALEALREQFNERDTSPPVPLLSFLIKAIPHAPITLILETPDGPHTKIITKLETKGLRAITAELETPAPATTHKTTLTAAQPEIKPIWSGETFTARRILPLTLTYDPRTMPPTEATHLLARLTTILADFRLSLL